MEEVLRCFGSFKSAYIVNMHISLSADVIGHIDMFNLSPGFLKVDLHTSFEYRMSFCFDKMLTECSSSWATAFITTPGAKECQQFYKTLTISLQTLIKMVLGNTYKYDKLKQSYY